VYLVLMKEDDVCCRYSGGVSRGAEAWAEIGGRSRGVNADPLSFPPPSLPRLPLLSHPHLTSPLKSSC